LREAAAAHFFGHAAGEEDTDGLQEGREKAEADEGRTEKEDGDPAEEGSQGRIRDVAPGEMAGVFQNGELVAVEAVAVGGEEMEKDSGGREQAEKDEIVAVA